MSRPEPLEPNDAVFDRHSGLVGVVHEQHGSRVTLKRPSGLRWETRAVSVRTANYREVLQLRALAKHNRAQQRLVGGKE